MTGRLLHLLLLLLLGHDFRLLLLQGLRRLEYLDIDDALQNEYWQNSRRLEGAWRSRHPEAVVVLPSKYLLSPPGERLSHSQGSLLLLLLPNAGEERSGKVPWEEEEHVRGKLEEAGSRREGGKEDDGGDDDGEVVVEVEEEEVERGCRLDEDDCGVGESGRWRFSLRNFACFVSPIPPEFLNFPSRPFLILIPSNPRRILTCRAHFWR